MLFEKYICIITQQINGGYMQIVIDISKKDYDFIKSIPKGETNYLITLTLYEAVKNGKLLSEYNNSTK